VPVLHDLSVEEAVRLVPAGGSMSVSGDGLKTSFAVPRLARSMVGLCDGQRTLADIHAALREKRADLDWPMFLRHFGELYAVLNGINRMLLRCPSR
jgi:hypothetical protein